MGSKSNSSTSSTNITKNFAFNNVDNRVLIDGERGGIESNFTFNVGEGALSGNNLTRIRTDKGITARARAAADRTSRGLGSNLPVTPHPANGR